MNSKISNIKESPEREALKNNIEVWEDLVSIRDLVISLIICTIMSLGGYFLAPNTPPKPLFGGLAGAILGFVICAVLIKPKRVLIETDQED